MTAKPSNKHFHNNFTLPINQKPYSDIQKFKTPNGPNISLTIEEKNHAKICRQFLINCHWSAKTEKNRCLTTLKLFLSLSFAYYMILRVYKSSCCWCCCCCGVFFLFVRSVYLNQILIRLWIGLVFNILRLNFVLSLARTHSAVIANPYT